MPARKTTSAPATAAPRPSAAAPAPAAPPVKPTKPSDAKPVKAAASAKPVKPAPSAKPGKAAAAAKPLKPAAAPKPAKPPKAPKPPKVRQKPVRDSFTMPEADFSLIATLKARALAAKRETKKSELLRAGLHALAAMDSAALLAALQALEPIKTGRPKKAH